MTPKYIRVGGTNKALSFVLAEEELRIQAFCLLVSMLTELI
jgi:hypothetical protein